jgi:hypothetical protein
MLVVPIFSAGATEKMGHQPWRFSLREENAVLLVPQHGNQVPRRVGLFRLEPEARLLGGPFDRGFSAEEIAFEMLRVVFNLCRRKGTVPFHIEGNLRADREDPRDRRGGKPQPLCQGVGKVVVVKDIQATHEQAGPRSVEVNLDGIVSHWDHPEHVVSIDMYVVVVDL